MDNIFEKGLKLDVSEHVEKKGKFSYLSWAYAVQELRKLDPKASWEVIHFSIGPNGCDPTPYMKTETGYFVEVIVTMGNGVRLQQVHPVLDNYNKPILKPNSFQVNTSIQRCLTKAIALASGIGLYLYAGEDLPPSDSHEEISVDIIKDYLPNCDTIKTLNNYYAKNKKFIAGLLDKENSEVIAAFTKRKEEIEGGNNAKSE